MQQIRLNVVVDINKKIINVGKWQYDKEERFVDIDDPKKGVYTHVNNPLPEGCKEIVVTANIEDSQLV